MSREILKDRHFRVSGYLETKDNQDQVLQDHSFRIIGYYDAKQNITKDHTFRVVGYGNLLMTLLPDD